MTNLQPMSYSVVKSESIFSEIRNKTKMLTFITFIQHSIGSSSHSVRQEEAINTIHIGKEEVKLPLFADDMILYVENPKDATKNYLN